MSTRSIGWRLFLTCWVLYPLHFTTNVVREHYPAFALVDHGSFRLDEYSGFHADIFEHRDGHWYICNQVTASVAAAVPLFVFDPVLDALEEHRKRQVESGSAPRGEYELEYALGREFYSKVLDEGLDLRFGAAAFVTSAFLMALLCGLFALLIFRALLSRGVGRNRASWLAMLFAFGTPVFYRGVSLSHNVFLAIAIFGAFLLLWSAPGAVPSRKRLLWAGFLSGLGIALDYAGVIPLLVLFGYLLATLLPRLGRHGTVRPALLFVLGSVPPVLFLLYTQWISFGNPFLPAQMWMPMQNTYVGLGVQGMTLPDPELFLRNLLDLDWGLFPFAPLLVLALLPIARSRAAVFPHRERWFLLVFALAFMLFCAGNQYARLQWNTGFRYLLPLVPFAFLACCDHLVRVRTRTLVLVTIPVVLHTWILTMAHCTPPFRGDPQAVPESWRRFLGEGVQYKWLTVLRGTPSLEFPLLRSPLLPYLLLLVAGALVAGIWLLPRRGRV